jgi:hypothetical protein
MSSQKWTISLVKQGKFKVGAVPADGLGHILLKTFFVFIKWGSQPCQLGLTPLIFGRFDRLNAFSF